MKIVVIIAIVVLCVGIIGYIGTSVFIANKFLKPLYTQFTQQSTDIAPDGIDFNVKTSDNLNISGWLFKNNGAKCAIVLIPGIHQNRISGDYGGQGIAQLLLANDYGVAVYDPRGTGLSGGNTVGFGSTEGRDVLAVLKYLSDNGYSKKDIGLIGSSLGGITTLQNLDALKDTGAIIVDSAATAVMPIIEREMKKENIPSFLNPGIFTAAKIIFGVDIASVRPIDKVTSNTDTPILFMHGTKDSFIPFENSKELVAASGSESKLVAFEDADHVQSFKTNPQLFEQTVFSFLSQQMPQCTQ